MLAFASDPMRNHDRRIFQRLRLARPILGALDDQNALILDLGVAGALVEHYGVTTSNSPCRLQFRWHSDDIEFVCEVARTHVVRESGNDVISHTGLRFIEAVGDSDARLHDLMATFVGGVLAAQKANADGVRFGNQPLLLMEVGGARRTRVRGLVSYRLQEPGSWKCSTTIDPKQPPDGFTVAAYEYEDDLEILCRAYEMADEEGRRLIRLVAELSVRTVTLS